MVSFKQHGDFSNIRKYLEKGKKGINDSVLNEYGQIGVAALAAHTPVRTGKTAKSWSYSIEKKEGSVSLSFHNSNIQNGVPIAIILQYGHGTNNGGWVEGVDYINPAIRPVFEEISEKLWKEVSKL